jgi:mycofactocin precursor
MHKEPKPVTEVAENNGCQAGQEEPQILEEIVVEELSIDGICGVY